MRSPKLVSDLKSNLDGKSYKDVPISNLQATQLCWRGEGKGSLTCHLLPTLTPFLQRLAVVESFTWLHQFAQETSLFHDMWYVCNRWMSDTTDLFFNCFVYVTDWYKLGHGSLGTLSTIGVYVSPLLPKQWQLFGLRASGVPSDCHDLILVFVGTVDWWEVEWRVHILDLM